MAGIGSAAQRFWHKHGNAILQMGAMLATEGMAAGDAAPELNAGQLEGRSPAEIEEMIPDSWAREPTSGSGGTRYVHPTNRGEQIRVMPGNPDDPNPIKRAPYARISRNGKISDPIPLKGNPEINP